VVRPRVRALLLTLVVVSACSRVTARTNDRERTPAGASSLASAAPRPSSSPSNVPKATPPEGFIEATVAGSAAVGAGHAVLLVDAEQRRAVPIFIGGTEGHSIDLRLSGGKAPRPLTHDLFDSALVNLGARVHSARVVKLEAGIYFAVLVLVSDGRLRELDSRASDAVAMALGAGVPIFVAVRVLEQAGISLDSLKDGGVSAPQGTPPHIAL
jgi:bifunctional DNase/RNase